MCTCGFETYEPEDQENEGDEMFKILQKLITGKPGEQKEGREVKQRKRQHISHMNSPQLLIIDPLNRMNNIGKSSYNFAMI